MKTVKIPEAVLEMLSGSEIVAHPTYIKNTPDIQARAREDAQYLIDINFDGYEDYKRSIGQVRKFLQKLGD